MSNSAFYRGLELAQTAARGAAADPATRAASVQAAVDRELAASPSAAVRACQAGCSFCCRHPVGVTLPEAIHLRAAIDRLPPQQRQERIAAVTAAATCTAAMPWGALAALACPLLIDGRCSVYAARPLPCRSWASFDATACERHSRGAGDIPCDTDAFALGLGASAGLGPDGQAELRSALAAMLHAEPDDVERAFAAARRAGT
ncbi:MAG: YkgJ family cysteine cluster protein [Planctomycetes bacterium]|nr:YkgJ family cysteine cluster protein [Planctomycetota bacterium]